MKARLRARIWNNIELDESGCWIWQRRKNKGYGVINVCLPGSGHRKLYAHRVSYEAFRVTIPSGKILAHSTRCTSPACCNPWHLRATSMTQNNLDIPRARRWRERALRVEVLGIPIHSTTKQKEAA